MIANIGGHWVNPEQVTRIKEGATPTTCQLVLTSGVPDLTVNMTVAEAVAAVEESQVKHALKVWQEWYNMPLPSPFKSLATKDCYEEVSP
jgi:hypothetical protein